MSILSYSINAQISIDDDLKEKPIEEKQPVKQLVGISYDSVSSTTQKYSDGTATTTIGFGTVNAPLKNGSFIPVADYYSLDNSTPNVLTVRDFYGNSEKIFEVNCSTVDKSICNADIRVFKRERDWYFYTDVSKDITSMKYELDKGTFINNKLSVGNYQVDFTEAKEKQGINVVYDEKSKSLDFGTAKMVDPVVSYDLVSNESFFSVWRCNSADEPPPNSWVESFSCTSRLDITTDTDIQSSDDSYVTIPASSDYTYLYASIDLTSFIRQHGNQSIKVINWTWEGQEEAGSGTITFYLYNFTGNSYSSYATTSSGTDVFISSNYRSNMINVINATNNKVWFIAGNSNNRNLITDLLKFQVEFEHNVNVTFQTPTTSSPKSVVKDQSFEIGLGIADWGVNLTSGVSLVEGRAGNINLNFTNYTLPVGTMKIRADNWSNTSTSGTARYNFSTMGNTNYASLIEMIEDGGTKDYSIEAQIKNDGGYWIQIDDNAGTASAHKFMSSAISYGSYYTGIPSIGYLESGGTTTSGLSTLPFVFTNNFNNDDYAVICTPRTDSDSAVCAVDNTSKTTTGFSLYGEDDGGGTETLDSGIDYLAVPYGEYLVDGHNIKAGGVTQAGGSISVTFATAFPNVNYTIFTNHQSVSIGTDILTCTIQTQLTTGFTSICADDGGTATNGIGFDWVAFEEPTFNGLDLNLTMNASAKWNDSEWIVNVTQAPDLAGLQNLFINLSYDGLYYNQTEINALYYAPLFSSYNKQINETLSLATLTQPSGKFSRFQSQILNIDGSTNRNLKSNRWISSILSTDALTETLKRFFRINSISISLDNLVSRAQKLTKIQTQQINLNIILNRFSSLFKESKQQIEVNTNTTRLPNYQRAQNENITLTSTTTKALILIRAPFEQLGINTGLDRIWYLWREFDETITFDINTFRLSNLIKEQKQDLIFTVLTARAYQGTRQIDHSINLNSFSSRFTKIFRINNIQLTITDSMQRIKEMTRSVNLNIVISESITRSAKFIRSLIEIIKALIGLGTDTTATPVTPVTPTPAPQQGGATSTTEKNETAKLIQEHKEAKEKDLWIQISLWAVIAMLLILIAISTDIAKLSKKIRFWTQLGIIALASIILIPLGILCQGWIVGTELTFNIWIISSLIVLFIILVVAMVIDIMKHF